jgi:hypothetical protein
LAYGGPVPSGEANAKQQQQWAPFAAAAVIATTTIIAVKIGSVIATMQQHNPM